MKTLDQIDLADIFRTFHPKAAEYTFFSSAYGTFYKIDHILVTSKLQQIQKVEVIPCTFPDHNSMRPEVPGKTTNTWRLNNMLLNNEWVNQEIKKINKIK